MGSHTEKANCFLCKQKQMEMTWTSSGAVPDQKGVEEGGTKLKSGGGTRENPQNREGAERERGGREKQKEHLGVSKRKKKHLDTTALLSIITGKLSRQSWDLNLRLHSLCVLIIFSK